MDPTVFAAQLEELKKACELRRQHNLRLQHLQAWTPPPQQTQTIQQTPQDHAQQLETHQTPMDHTPTGYAPYTRKRRNSTPSGKSPTQVHTDTKNDSLPHWHTTPPQPSQSPTTVPQQPHTLSPLLPTPSQPPSHQTIPPLMSIKFTPPPTPYANIQLPTTQYIYPT